MGEQRYKNGLEGLTIIFEKKDAIDELDELINTNKIPESTREAYIRIVNSLYD